MQIYERRAIRIGQLSIVLAAICSILLERLWLGHTIPKDFHPAATAAVGTAIIGWIVWWIISLAEILNGAESESGTSLGLTTGCFFLSTAGLLIGIGESGCSAWMLAATPITIALGILWWDVIYEYIFRLDASARNIRFALIKSGLVVLFLLAPLAAKFEW